MKARILAILLVLAAASIAHGQCQPQVQAISAKGVIDINLCPPMKLDVGANFTITADGVALPVTVTRAVDDPLLGLNVRAVPIDAGSEALVVIVKAKTVTVTVGDETATANVQPDRIPVAENYHKYDWSIGPATKGEEDGDSEEALTAEQETNENSGDSGALRLKYSGEYARGGAFGQMDEKRFQTTGTLSIDTTDQDDADLIDNNRLAVNVGATGLSLGRLWVHGTAGIEGRVEKAFHRDIHNADVVAKVSGWVPVLRSFTFFPQNGEFIAPPLSFSASYGYRNREQLGASSSGRVFEAAALYHLFLFDKFQVDLSGTFTHSDLSDLPAGTPRTQRMYKATISYLENPENGFKVLTSIENGSFGVMLREVRQYFVGVAISKLNFSGLTGGN